jgi:hypothetical protein
VVIFGERHAARLAGEYIAYHHEDRCHLGLDKYTPDERPVTSKQSPTSKIIARWAAPSVRVARRSLIGGGFGEKIGAWQEIWTSEPTCTPRLVSHCYNLERIRWIRFKQDTRQREVSGRKGDTANFPHSAGRRILRMDTGSSPERSVLRSSER